MLVAGELDQSVLKDEWWRGSVIYQIYPRSFQDSNGDGIGDLAGIVQRLDYIASLGVDAIWISPFFPSPMQDFGYDVSDYCDIDPIFGTLADFDCVIAKAHALGIKVLIDLVMSHTSDQHAWFQQSKVDKNNDKADWYVWADPKPDGTPPTNWLSIFGGSAWQWEGSREQYYLHNFLTSQPDLNFHNVKVQDALLDVAKFWLDRGVDGFRLDTINFYFHDKDLRDNPPLKAELRNANIAPSVNPYNHQEHLYDKNRPENLDFLKRLRALMVPYDAAAVGEVGDAQRGLEILGQYTAGNELMHMCYAFEFLTNDRPDAQEIADVMAKFDQCAPDGWACWAFSNHDVVRQASRWNLGLGGLKLICTMLMCFRGSTCIFQGEELGLEEAEIAYSDLQDPYGIAFWPEFKGRDGCRTPMVWKSADDYSGFSQTQPWLPIPEKHLDRSVEQLEQDSQSLLHHYRRAIALRKSHPVLQVGDSSTVSAVNNVVSFTRIWAHHQLFCAFNLGDRIEDIEIPFTKFDLLGEELGAAIQHTHGKVTLQPWQSILAKKI